MHNNDKKTAYLKGSEFGFTNISTNECIKRQCKACDIVNGKKALTKKFSGCIQLFENCKDWKQDGYIYVIVNFSSKITVKHNKY